jgi:hypothetical protein
MAGGVRFVSMQNPPDSPVVQDLLMSAAHERDAAWAAKLAILRLRRVEHIAFLGECLRQHDLHARELASLVRAADRRVPVPSEPRFLTPDALVIGALDDADRVLAALEELEAQRIRRYEARLGRQHPGTVGAVLGRHYDAARARLVQLQRLPRGRVAASAA